MSETELVGRLEKLERDNRRLKTLALAMALLFATMGTLYATRPVPRTIAAHDFDVLDGLGKVRARIGMQVGGPLVELYDDHARPRVRMWMRGDGWPEVAILGPRGKTVASMGSSLWSGGGLLVLGDSQGGPRVEVDAASPWGSKGVWIGGGETNASVQLTASSQGAPTIDLSDARGFSMELGRAATENSTTGETQNTSAASIIMFGNGKDHHVIWQAP